MQAAAKRKAELQQSLRLFQGKEPCQEYRNRGTISRHSKEVKNCGANPLKPGSAQSSTEGTMQGLLWKLESQSSTEEPIPQANTQIRILQTAKEGVIHT